MYLKTKEANRLYKEGKYEQALKIYEELNVIFKKDLFNINIKLCKKYLPSAHKVGEKHHSEINLAFITDINYAMPTYVAIQSIAQNMHSKYKYNVYVIVVDMDAEKSKIFYELNNNLNIIIKNYKSNSKFIIKKDDGFHVSPAAIAKFELADILPNLDKVLYLDGDIIVKNNLIDLYNTDINNKYAAVVEDMKPKYKYKPSILKKLNIESHNAYFNSGVMLLNLKKFRMEKISSKLFHYREYGKNFFMDQDAFNVIIGGNVILLHPENNFMTTIENSFSINELNKIYDLKSSYSSYAEAYRKAKIIHFSSKNKPWKNYRTSISKAWYLRYIASRVYAKFGLHHEVEKLINLNKILVSYTISDKKNLINAYSSITSILEQTFKPDKIILWVCKNIIKSKKDIDKSILELEKRGVIINYCKNGSCNKLSASVDKYPEYTAISANEDILYEKDWLLKKISSFIQNDEIIII